MPGTKHQNLAENDWFVIVNPVAGNRLAEGVWSKMKSYFDQIQLKYTVATTNRPGDGMRIGREVVQRGSKKLMIFGGDGTHHEVINGILSASPATTRNICYTMYPCGSGNDFARHFGIPKRIGAWIDYINSANACPIDAGVMISYGRDPVYFINEAGIGLEYEVVHRRRLTPSSGNGRIGYLLEALRTLAKYKGVRVRVQDDQKNSSDEYLWNLTIANGRYLGGGFQLCPEASMTDGQLTYTMVQYVEPWRLIKDILRFFNGNVAKLTYSRGGASSVLLVEPLDDDEVLIQLDGEINGVLPAEFRTLKKVINFYIPVQTLQT